MGTSERYQVLPHDAASGPQGGWARGILSEDETTGDDDQFHVGVRGRCRG